MLAGYFQEQHPTGMSFGHAAAMIQVDSDTASAKRVLLETCGVPVADSLLDIPKLLMQSSISPSNTVTAAVQ
jgi:succinyl-CoA synthetase alpha subunit